MPTGYRLHRDVFDIVKGDKDPNTIPRMHDSAVGLVENLLPHPLLHSLSATFAHPETAYFRRNQYGQVGFFGHWVPWADKPRNAVEQVVSLGVYCEY